MIWTAGPTGEVTYVGTEWTQLTGQSGAEALGSGWLTALHEDDRSAVHDLFLRACNENASFTVQYRLRRPDASFTWVIAGAVPSISPIDGRFLGYLGSLGEIGDAMRDLAARREVGQLSVPVTAASKLALTPLDLIADNVLVARAAAERSGEAELFSCLDLALTLIQMRVGGSPRRH